MSSRLTKGSSTLSFKGDHEFIQICKTLVDENKTLQFVFFKNHNQHRRTLIWRIFSKVQKRMTKFLREFNLQMGLRKTQISIHVDDLIAFIEKQVSSPGFVAQHTGAGFAPLISVIVSGVAQYLACLTKLRVELLKYN
jgi:hypothetical protein